MSKTSRSGHRGLTLIEICFTMSLVVVLAYLSLSALKPGSAKASTRGAAVALAEEFEAAKQLAIRSGQPVALGIPPTKASSIYRLQGWNVPYINWSRSFSGDHPEVAFASATWAGASGVGGAVATPPTAKFFNFDQAALLNWLPTECQNDYIYCFLPDGSLMTNELPSSDGRYTLVVAENPVFGGSAPSDVVITAGDEPITLFISPNGGVELVTGCPGGSLAAGSAGIPESAPKLRTQAPDGNAQRIRLSELIVRPNPVGGNAQEGVCVPGAYVTLEIYAYSPQGVPLFANWNHSPGSVTNEEGIFAYPQGQSGILTGEADRMEFVPAHLIPSEDPAHPNFSPDAPVWSSAPAPDPNQGVFRAQWTWTVPPVSDTGDSYSLTVNVQNATADATVENPPPPYVINPNPIPRGRLIVERFSGPPQNIWQLWRMNPDGSGERLLSPAGVQETMASVDRAANKMAFIQGEGANRRVKIRFLEGGGEQTVSVPAEGNYTGASISPDGTWVAYRNDGTNQVRVTRIAGGADFSAPQTWGGTGNGVLKGRPGWSVDGRYVLFGFDQELRSLDTMATGAITTVSGGVDTGGGVERVFAPIAFRPGDGLEYVIFSGGNFDPVLAGFEAGPGPPIGPGPNYGATIRGSGNMASFPHSPDLNGLAAPGLGSGNIDDDYPSVSVDGRQLLVTRSPEGLHAGEDVFDQTVSVYSWDNGARRFLGPAAISINGNVRRAIWIP